MSYLKFNVQVRTWVVEEADPDNKWDNGTTDGSVDVVGVRLVPDDGYDTLYFDSDLKKGDVIYLVYAQYTTGDSFGSYGGEYELLEVKRTPQEAFERAKYYENLPEPKDFSGDEVRMPWHGYFERLDYIKVASLEVE